MLLRTCFCCTNTSRYWKKLLVLQPPFHTVIIMIPSWMWKMCLLSERGQTWVQIFITCAETRWRQHIHHGNVSHPFPIKSGSLFPAWALASTGVYSDQRWVGPAAVRFNHPHLAPPGFHWLWLFLKLLLLSILPAVAGGDIKAAAGQRRAFLTLAPSFISPLHRPRQWQWKDFTIPLGRNSFHQSSIMLSPAAVPLT